jgi:hypothetical protein
MQAAIASSEHSYPPAPGATELELGVAAAGGEGSTLAGRSVTEGGTQHVDSIG